MTSVEDWIGWTEKATTPEADDMCPKFVSSPIITRIARKLHRHTLDHKDALEIPKRKGHWGSGMRFVLTM
jgi:hypothetical protein